MSTATGKRPVVVLISGRGSNMVALARAAGTPGSGYDIAAVIADRPAAPGLAAAAQLGLDARVVAPASRADAGFERRLATAVRELRPAVVALAGFMRILSPEFLAQFPGRVLNIHPSLLPKHPGLHTHARALAAGDDVHGATVHFVTAELDGGPRILQGRVPVRTGDDEARLAARVLAVEHRLYPLAVSWMAAGRLECRGGLAHLDGTALGTPLQLEDLEPRPETNS